MDPTFGTLFLVPCHLSEDNKSNILPDYTVNVAKELVHWVVESDKTARRFLRDMGTQIPLNDLQFSLLTKDTKPELVKHLLAPALNGHSMGMMSEAGCPAVADPGNLLVAAAHQMGIRVVPLVGPSSILMALMASGMSGQQFAFHGYLPIDREQRKKALQELEQNSKKRKQTQIFMETPFRNDGLVEDALKWLQPSTRFSISVDLTGTTEWNFSGTVAQWKKMEVPSFHKRLAVYCLLG
jgi:16S rRNA (cytidine1402-2'-O)-methyltransferase